MWMNLGTSQRARAYWDIRVEGDKNFSLFSDELVINLGHKRPAIRFTKDGMSTICSKCDGEVRYGVQGKIPNWWCARVSERFRCLAFNELW